MYRINLRWGFDDYGSFPRTSQQLYVNWSTSAGLLSVSWLSLTPTLLKNRPQVSKSSVVFSLSVKLTYPCYDDRICIFSILICRLSLSVVTAVVYPFTSWWCVAVSYMLMSILVWFQVLCSFVCTFSHAWDICVCHVDLVSAYVSPGMSPDLFQNDIIESSYPSFSRSFSLSLSHSDCSCWFHFSIYHRFVTWSKTSPTS